MKPFALKFAFDAVVMLTWSDWHTEPRSNRYHYAMRFARHLPVYFVQADGEEEVVRFEPVPDANITLVHVLALYDEADAHRLDEALKAQGVFRPLLWIYNTFFEDYIRLSRPRLRVYHATEDYVTPTEGLRATKSDVIGPLCRTLKRVDLLVAVSEGVAAAYRKHAGYTGRCITLPNGCDYEYWRATGAQSYVPPENGARVAIFQGGINERLDYDLLIAAVQRLPDWQFWFCGWDNDAPPKWRSLLARPNVVHFGHLPVDSMAQLAKQALVGLIPFKQDPWIERSLPLKAYEYVASGLPVVSVPIDALRMRGDLFAIETTVEGFASAIERLEGTRTAPFALAARNEAAFKQSYDTRFSEAVATIGGMIRQSTPSTSSLNILMLYDDESAIVRTVYEHLQCFKKYSRHNYHFTSATYLADDRRGSADDLDFGCFDALVVHYSVRVSVTEHIVEAVVSAIKRYRGPKVLFIQDEYENTETARQWIERLGIDSVYTNIPSHQVPLIYPPHRFPLVDFVETLTGYVPEDPDLDLYALPLAERPIHLGYRGRQLQHHYGVLGYDKYRIGHDMQKLCADFGIPADIEVEHARRIHGSDWYKFVGSCRAMLGTESGSNVFDFDGSLKALSKRYAKLTFEEFSNRFLKDVPTPVHMEQVSPKIFEAIRLRTALVLFEGSYSGVVEPEAHYIPLKKDYSNVQDVFKAISDLDYLREVTERASRDIVDGQRYSYRTFVESCDRYLDARVGRHPRATVVSVPLVGLTGGGKARLWPISARRPGIVTSGVAESPAALDDTNAVIMAALNMGKTKTDLARPAVGKMDGLFPSRRRHAQRAGPTREISSAGLVPPREAVKLAREIELYRAEIAHLNTVYPAEVARLREQIVMLSDGASSRKIPDFRLIAIPILRRSANIGFVRAAWRRLPLGIRRRLIDLAGLS